MSEDLPQNRWCPYCLQIIYIESWEDWYNHLEMDHDLVIRRKDETEEQAITRVKAKNPRMGTPNCQCPRCIAERRLKRALTELKGEEINYE